MRARIVMDETYQAGIDLGAVGAEPIDTVELTPAETRLVKRYMAVRAKYCELAEAKMEAVERAKRDRAEAKKLARRHDAFVKLTAGVSPQAREAIRKHHEKANTLVIRVVTLNGHVRMMAPHRGYDEYASTYDALDALVQAEYSALNQVRYYRGQQRCNAWLARHSRLRAE